MVGEKQAASCVPTPPFCPSYVPQHGAIAAGLAFVAVQTVCTLKRRKVSRGIGEGSQLHSRHPQPRRLAMTIAT